jgi:uncharacterized low-complexity protein
MLTNINPLSIALGAALAAPAMNCEANENPFSMTVLSSGYTTMAWSESADSEGKCGEGKCGDTSNYDPAPAKADSVEGKYGEAPRVNRPSDSGAQNVPQVEQELNVLEGLVKAAAAIDSGNLSSFFEQYYDIGKMSDTQRIWILDHFFKNVTPSIPLEHKRAIAGIVNGLYDHDQRAVLSSVIQLLPETWREAADFMASIATAYAAADKGGGSSRATRSVPDSASPENTPTSGAESDGYSEPDVSGKWTYNERVHCVQWETLRRAGQGMYFIQRCDNTGWCANQESIPEKEAVHSTRKWVSCP